MTHDEIRQKFLDFFEKRGHKTIPSASLVTTDEPGQTNKTLFNSAGMQPLVPYLMGEDHPGGRRLASSQKCLRTNDIEEVGDNTHLTFFEMLGNWSLGDYFKEDAIKWSYEFLTSEEGLGLDKNRLYFTVFAGNESVPRDEESADIWKSIGIPESRIYYFDSKDNWWSAGADSPAGPSTEMHYDMTGSLGDLSHDEFVKASDEQSIVEIWNDVFMTYRQEGGEVVGELSQKNVDTGAGFERVTVAVQGKSNVYETTIFVPALSYIKENSADFNEKDARIVADHMRSILFLVSDGVFPSNTDRGYVLRRLMRRMILSARKINFSGSFDDLIEMFENQYIYVYENLSKLKTSEIFEQEKEKFEKAIARGEKEFGKLASKEGFVLTGKELSLLEQTHGLPTDLSISLAEETGVSVSENLMDEYEEEQRSHKEKSRTAAEGKFKGGLAGDSEMEIKYHTATHLLHQALREVLGNHVVQKGSNITTERLRFDFSHTEKMTDEEKKRVEDLVNEKIEDALPVIKTEMTLEQAKAQGALGVFDDKYEEEVSVYQVGEGDDLFSKEICGGPHVENTKELGKFTIKKEEASSAGVRRIKAVLE
jgi:alanyl-tRNA synthetase